MKPTLRQQLASIADAIDCGELDYAQGELANLIRELTPPVPTMKQQDAVLNAMRAGHHSAAAIKLETGIKTSIIYPARYLLHSRGLIIKYDNGLAAARWGCESI